MGHTDPGIKYIIFVDVAFDREVETRERAGRAASYLSVGRGGRLLVDTVIQAMHVTLQRSQHVTMVTAT